MDQSASRKVIVLLENIRSMENVGSIFRTCDALAVEKIYLAGHTPSPLDKFNRPQGKLIKAALGAEKSIPWEKIADSTPILKKLKKEDYQIVAIEQGINSKPYSKVKPKSKVVFILGSEVDGVNKKTLALADILAEIPMKGKKESLNVAVSAGIALFRILEN